jgi:hypothetical protein
MREVSLLRSIVAGAEYEREPSGTFLRVVLDADRVAEFARFDGATRSFAEVCDVLLLAQRLTIQVTVSDLEAVRGDSSETEDEHPAHGVVEADIDMRFVRWLDAGVTGVLCE